MMKMQSSMGLKRGGQRLLNFAEVKTSRIFNKLFPPKCNERQESEEALDMTRIKEPPQKRS